MNLKSFLEARKHSDTKKQESKEKTKNIDLVKSETIHPKIFSYFFELQSRLEKDATLNQANFNYKDYALRIWQEVIEDGEEQYPKEYLEIFTNLLIRELHNINMEEHIYPEIKENLKKLVEKYVDEVKHISLWSTGDTITTGYQSGKIGSSKIINNYINSLNEIKNNHTETRTYLKEKTSYMVDDNKFSRLVEFVENEITNTNTAKIKIVIIEDSRNNFTKVEKELKETLSIEDFAKIEIVPIWATYSREGISASKETSFEDGKSRLNGISSFDELLNEKFETILKDSYLFVDFDGVLGNNVKMREDQAKVIWKSLLTSLSKEGISEQELQNKILSKL